VVLGFGATGVISLLHFKAEESEYRRDRLKRKEEAVEAHVAYELKRAQGANVGQGDILKVLHEELCAISRIHRMDVALYTMSGSLQLSSSMDLVEEGILPPQLPDGILSRREQILSIPDSTKPEGELLLYTAELNDEMGVPVAIMVVPYGEGLERPMEDMDFFKALAWLHLVLFFSTTRWVCRLPSWSCPTARD